VLVMEPMSSEMRTAEINPVSSRRHQSSGEATSSQAPTLQTLCHVLLSEESP